jgi:hypothetical protein
MPVISNVRPAVSPDRSLNFLVTMVSAFLVVPALLLGCYLAAARIPVIFSDPGLLILDLCLCCFWLWLIAAVWLGSVILRACVVTPSLFFGMLFISSSLASLGFLQAFPKQWIYLSLPLISACLLLWRSGVRLTRRSRGRAASGAPLS